jgi:amidase
MVMTVGRRRPRSPAKRWVFRSVAAVATLVHHVSLLGHVPSAPPEVGGTDGSHTLQCRLDHDLREITISRLERLYVARRYTAQQVISWYLARVAALNPTYKAIVYVYGHDALARAQRLDAAARSGASRGSLWAVPIVIKDNTNIAGKITATGWEGYARPGAELVARRNAHVVDLLERAGAVIIGHSNLPDLAMSDSNVSSLGGRTGNAYDVNFSPGGSSGGSAVAVALNMAVLGQGTDTGNSLRNPASNSAVVAVFPTAGLVSLQGIHPFDLLYDNTGPMARTVTDAAIALDAMVGNDAKDPRPLATPVRFPTRSYTTYLRANTLRGKRFAVPYFILEGSPHVAADDRVWDRPVSQATRHVLMRALAQMRAAGATIIIKPDILSEEFVRVWASAKTKPYRILAINQFLKDQALPRITSVAELESSELNFPIAKITGGVPQTAMLEDPHLEANYLGPRWELLTMYESTLRKYRLDGFVYPALQVPSNDERVPLPHGYPSDGPYSNTMWLNLLGAPSVVVPAGFYPNGLPFGLEIAGDLWTDGELLGYAHAFEMKTHARRAPNILSSLDRQDCRQIVSGNQ